MSPLDHARAFGDNQVDLATFEVHGREYAIDVGQIREIVRAVDPTPLPKAPALIEGVIDLRGGVVPVVDLGRALGGEPVPPGAATRIVLLLSITWVMRLTADLFEVLGSGISGKDLILIFGGLFLIAKATHEIHDKLEHAEGERQVTQAQASFVSVVVQIALIDIVFSLDSVITAVGMVDEIAIMVAAVVVAIVVMMVFAGSISRFVERHPAKLRPQRAGAETENGNLKAGPAKSTRLHGPFSPCGSQWSGARSPKAPGPRSGSSARDPGSRPGGRNPTSRPARGRGWRSPAQSPDDIPPRRGDRPSTHRDRPVEFPSC